MSDMDDLIKCPNYRKLVEETTEIVASLCNELQGTSKPSVLVLFSDDDCARKVAENVLPNQLYFKFAIGVVSHVFMVSEHENMPSNAIAPSFNVRDQIEAPYCPGHVRVVTFGRGYVAVYDQKIAFLSSVFN